MSKKNVLINFIKDFVKDCNDKNILILASSSSFFFILCLIPSTLLLLSFLTWFFESVTPAQTFTFLGYIESIVPDEIMPTFQTVFKHSKTMIIANKQLNTLHYVILGMSSLGFFGSVWKSIDLITGAKKLGTFMRTLKSFISIALSFAFILIIVSLPLIYQGINYVLSYKLFTSLRDGDGLISIISNQEVFGINFFSTMLLFVFFIFFFRFLLHGKTNIKSTIIGSAFFTSGIVITKVLFFAYLAIVKDNLIMNYGSLYSLMIFVLWIYAVILTFYMAIIFTYSVGKHRYKIGLNQ
jgi:uncharacterized BrkB/YihY/UPF0761 family membrane protein